MKFFVFYIALFACVFLNSCKDGDKSGQKAQSLSSKIENAVDSEDSLAGGLVDDLATKAEDIQNNVSAHSETTKTEINQRFLVDKSGIGNIKIGMNVKDIPSVYEGLYDQKKIIPNGSGNNVCLIYSKNEQIMELDYNNKTGLVSSIRLTSPSIKTEDGIRQFMDYSSLLKMPKVNKAIGNKPKDDVYDFVIDGVRYELEENIKGDKYVSAIVVGK